VRTVELAKVAVAAEALVLRREVRRQTVRVLFGLAAAVFAVAAAAVLHLVVYEVLRLYLLPIYAALFILVLDLVAAGALGWFALAGAPDPVQEEARQVRHQALEELQHSLTLVGMAAEIASLMLRTSARNRVRNGLAATLAAAATRLMGR
jgi:hypothetical protein